MVPFVAQRGAHGYRDWRSAQSRSMASGYERPTARHFFDTRCPVWSKYTRAARKGGFAFALVHYEQDFTANPTTPSQYITYLVKSLREFSTCHRASGRVVRCNGTLSEKRRVGREFVDVGRYSNRVLCVRAKRRDCPTAISAKLRSPVSRVSELFRSRQLVLEVSPFVWISGCHCATRVLCHARILETCALRSQVAPFRTQYFFFLNIFDIFPLLPLEHRAKLAFENFVRACEP